MDAPRALVIFKQTSFPWGDDEDARCRWLARIADYPQIAARIVTAQRDNERGLERVRRALDEAGLDHRWAPRATKRAAAEADLVITVGGDGTLLAASHAVDNQPVLGVNSSPSWSVGHFCATDADHVAACLERLRAGALRVVELTRIRAQIDGRALPYPALNEVLVAHPSPGGTTRYLLEVDGQSEAQWSSGVWIATPAGSTGAIASAGGDRMPLDGDELQIRVREPMRRRGELPRLVSARTRGPLHLVSTAPACGVHIDGCHIRYRVDFGGRVTLDTAAPPLRLYRCDAPR